MTESTTTTPEPTAEATPSEPGRGFPRRAKDSFLSRPRTAFTCALVLVILFAATALVSWQRAQEQDQTAQARVEALDQARKQAVALLSYDHRSIDQDLTRARNELTGPFQDEYTKLTAEVIAPVAKQQQTTTRANIVRSAVVAAEPDRVVVLLFLNQTTESTNLEAPRIDGSRVRMTLKKPDNHWLVSDLAPV